MFLVEIVHNAIVIKQLTENESDIKSYSQTIRDQHKVCNITRKTP